MKYIVLIFLMFFFASSWGQNSYTKEIPENWKIISQVSGDLNKDGIEDLVLIIENTDASNILKNEGMGAPNLNINPREILVFFKDEKNNYTLIEKNAMGFIHSENDEESTCLADPLMIDGGIKISNNILIVHFNYWLSCGSWSVNDASYKFRFQNNSFELIGFDHFSFNRATTEETRTSLNFSTKKKEETIGLNQSEESKPKTTKSTIKVNQLYKLKNCNENTYFEILEL
ncbi:MAG: hypothetical protein RSH24_15095 [Flavobacterium sp.]